MSSYRPEDIRRDATKFADSQFGQHYLARLKAAKKRAVADALDISLTTEFRAQRGAQAAAIDKEINYFRLAVMRVKEPTKFDRMLHRKAKEEGPDVDV